MVSTISLEPDEPTAVIGDKSTICVATVNSDDGTITYEYVDVDAVEKRQWDRREGAEQRGKRPRTQPIVENPSRMPSSVNQPIRMDMDPLPPTMTTPPSTRPTEKYKVISDIQKDLNVGAIGTRILELPVTMTV
jgi:hypothetical protein